MTVAAQITPLNPRPRRFAGRIHDTVRSLDPERGGTSSTATVLAGSNAEETVSLSLHAGPLGANLELPPDDAIRLGQILIAAGRETKEGVRTCEHEDCPNPPAGAGAFCGEHQGEP